MTCGGDQSCGKIPEIVCDEVLCGGDCSCEYSTIIASHTYCFGTVSCWSSNIFIAGNGFLDCGGYQSCNLATIHSPGNGSTVTVQVGSSMSVLNSMSIYCRESDICNVFILAYISASTIIICDGQCNVECPQELANCPSLVHLLSYMALYVKSTEFVCVLWFVYILALNGICQILYVHLDSNGALRGAQTITHIQIMLILRKSPYLRGLFPICLQWLTDITSQAPTRYPSADPIIVPSQNPTKYPSTDPTSMPSTNPTRYPSTEPTIEPTTIPSKHPSIGPTAASSAPTGIYAHPSK